MLLGGLDRWVTTPEEASTQREVRPPAGARVLLGAQSAAQSSARSAPPSEPFVFQIRKKEQT